MNKTQANQLQRDQQLTGNPEDAHAAQMDGRLKDLHTSVPGIIASFDPVKQTASVQPAIKRIFIDRGAVNLPLCVDVPVQFPRGGGFVLTFPVITGDECILVFSERAIDNWFVAGGAQEPFEYRMHDLSDGMAIVGISSLSNIIQNFSSQNVELRSIDHNTRVALHPDGTIENINATGSTVLSAAGLFTINAPAGIVLNGNVLCSGDVTASGKSLVHHIHGGVSAGAANTGQPL